MVEFGEFLRDLAGPGIGVAVGVILSFVVEYFPRYQNLEARYKRLVFFALCIAVPLAATVVAVVSGEWGVWPDFRGTWWPALVAGVTAGGAGTLVHARKLPAA